MTWCACGTSAFHSCLLSSRGFIFHRLRTRCEFEIVTAAVGRPRGRLVERVRMFVSAMRKEYAVKTMRNFSKSGLSHRVLEKVDPTQLPPDCASSTIFCLLQASWSLRALSSCRNVWGRICSPFSRIGQNLKFASRVSVEENLPQTIAILAPLRQCPILTRRAASQNHGVLLASRCRR